MRNRESSLAEMRGTAGSGFRAIRGFQNGVLFAALVFWGAAWLVSSARAQAQGHETFEQIETQASEAREAKRLDEAVELYRNGLRLKPGWTEGSWYMGTSLYGLGRFGEARDAFRHLALSQPGNGPAWALAGMCEFELKAYPRALEYLARAEATGLSGNQELEALVHFRIALLLNRDGEFDEAWGRLIAITAKGTYPEVIEALGLCVLRAQLLPSEVPEQDRNLYISAGEAMYASLTHDNESAARLFKELVDAYPQRPNVHNARGAFLMDSDPTGAMVEFQRELEIDPDDANATVRLATLYLKQGAADKALEYARNAVKIRPGMAASRRLLGEALLGSGDTAGAIEELGKAGRMDPPFPQTHFLLAEAYKRSGNRALATREMTEFERLEKKQEDDRRQGK